jgi:hypothetical protein
MVRFAALGAALLFSGTVFAQERVAAQWLFKEARVLMKHDDYATARLKLEESQRLDPSPGTLLNLAICNEHLGQIATA